jgi:hypothetical protein
LKRIQRLTRSFLKDRIYDGKPEEFRSGQDYTLSFRLTCDALHGENKKEAVIATPYGRLKKFAESFGKDILLGIEEFVLLSN